MKKVLILAYDFPPYVSVGGLRPYSWYKYFHEFGIHPVVVTRQWSNKNGNYLDYVAASESNEIVIEESEYGTIIKTPYKPNLANRIMLRYGNDRFVLLRKLFSAYYEFFQWLVLIGPKAGLYFGAKEYLKNNNVDYILATGSPFILFKYASMLSNRFNIKWIADYRDPWSHTSTRSKNILIKKFNMYFEKKCMKNVFKIVTVSEFVKCKIQSLIKNKPIKVIPNGYDHELINATCNVQQNPDVFSIGLAGSIYPWHTMKSILSVISEIVKEGYKMNLNLYGINIEKNIYTWIKDDFPALKEYVHVYSRMPNKDLLEKLASNNTLLLLNYYSFMGTKIYDYLGINRKIVFCFSNDGESLVLKSKFFPSEKIDGISDSLQEDLINETNSGIIVEDISKLKEVIINLIIEHENNKSIACNSTNYEQFSRIKQAEAYCNLFS
jgi:glycosyltransferase involved in cell wall biosynthesis